MAAGELDQQLEWDALQGFCQFWNANAQTFRPAFDYTARSVSVLLARYENVRRGKGIIRIERVKDPKAAGVSIVQWEWHSDELGEPGSPVWVSRGFNARKFKAGEEYRIVVHSIECWESFDEETGLWKPWEAGAAIEWAGWTLGDIFPHGEAQTGYNYRDNTGSYKSHYLTDRAFRIGGEALKQYTLLITISPPDGGVVSTNPTKGAYNVNESVGLLAIPFEGYEFIEWSGDLTSTNSTERITMDSDKSVMAYFEGSEIPDIPIVSDIIKWIKAELEKLKAWFTGMITAALASLEAGLIAAFETIIAPLTTGIDWLTTKISELWEWGQETWAKVTDIAENLFSMIVEGVTLVVGESLKWLKNRILDLWTWTQEIWAVITDLTANLFNIITSAISGAFDVLLNQANLILTGLTPDLDRMLAWNSPEVRAEVKSWFVFETTPWDYIKAWFKYVLYSPWILKDVFDMLWAKIRGEDIEPFQREVIEDLGKIVNSEQSIKDFFSAEVVDPITDWFQEKWDQLTSKFTEIFSTIWEGIKVFFTEILPNWFRTIWEKLRTAMAWIWDKATDIIESFFEMIIDLLKAIAPVSPAGGVGVFSGIVKIGLVLAGGLGLMTIAGKLVHPIHSIGLGSISAMVYDMSNYKVLTGAMIGALAAIAVRTPVTYYFNDLLRPWLPSPRDSSMMRSRQYISKDEYGRLLAYQGLPDQWHDHMDALTETRVGYFALAGVARYGVFDRELFYRDLHRAGYAEEIIGLLLNMYEKMADEAVQGMMGGAAVKRFKEGFTTEGVFADELMLLGYSPTQIPTFLAAAKLDYAYDYLNDLVAAYRDAVRKGHIDMEGYRGSLLALGIVPERVEGYVLRERARLKPEEPLTPEPTPKPEYQTDIGRVQVDTIRRRRRKDLINRNEEIAALQALGMSPSHAGAIADNDDVREYKESDLESI